ncbi:MAG: type II toxin-antitoxin system HicB family antitoxin [Thermodesulfobacteriota bacterium]
MKIQVLIHEAEEGGYWAEVPALPGTYTEGDTWEELMANIQEALELRLSVEVTPPQDPKIKVLELAL